MGLTENSKPCWEATCDECGEGDNSDWGGSFHYESREAAVKELGGYGWEVTDERVICEGCLDEEREARERMESGGKDA